MVVLQGSKSSKELGIQGKKKKKKKKKKNTIVLLLFWMLIQSQ